MCLVIFHHNVISECDSINRVCIQSAIYTKFTGIINCTFCITVFTRSNIGVVGSNPNRAMEVSVCLLSVILSCA
jgi:hypothetical protein